jgi:hypothetical protein
MKKVKNILKLMFFGRSEGKGRGGESGYQTGPEPFFDVKFTFISKVLNFCMHF